MPTYKYTAKDVNGKDVKGILEAADEDALYTALREKNQFLITAQDKDKTKEKRYGRIKTPALADYCRQLGTLLGAGVTMVRAFSIIAGEEGLDPRYARIYSDVQTLLRQGVPLSDAMEQQGNAFPELLINMFRSAESNGNFDKTALRMANHYEKEHRLHGKVVSAMTYPVVLLVLLSVIVVFMMVFLIPQFSKMFSEMESLPLPTVILLGISDAFKYHWYIILAVMIGIVVGWLALLRIPAVKMAKDHALIKLPIIGKLLKKIYTARFARTLSSLYSSGLPVIRAVQAASVTIGNTYITAQFDQIIAEVRAGEPLSQALKKVDGFQKKLASTIMVGEETGSLDSMLDSIADSLDYEAEKALERLVSMLEPLMIILMAIIVGFVIIAIIIPIYQSYSTIEQG